MTTKQADEIRALVDAGGWDAVRKHPVLSVVWAAALKESKRYEAAVE